MHLLDIYDHITEKNEYLFIRFIHACEEKSFLTTKITEYRFPWEDYGLKRTDNGNWRCTNPTLYDDESGFFSIKGDVAAIVGLQFVYHPNPSKLLGRFGHRCASGQKGQKKIPAMGRFLFHAAMRALRIAVFPVREKGRLNRE